MINFLKLLNDLETKKVKYLITGDINIDTLATNNLKIKNYMNDLIFMGCNQIILIIPTGFADKCKSSGLHLHKFNKLTNNQWSLNF